jgi:parallel beta-helix repeat protein
MDQRKSGARLLVSLLFAIAAAPARAQSDGCVPLVSDMDVYADVKICPGTYLIDDAAEDGVLRIKASGVHVDLEGVTLKSTLMKGWGILADGVDGVTITQGRIEGFRGAVLLQNGMGHLVQDSVLSFNRKRPVTHTGADFLSVWPDFPGQLAADQIGDGVVLVNVGYSAVRGCRTSDQQNGIGLFGCSHVEVVGNNCSGNEGWGIHVRRSSDSLIAQNYADDCFNKVSTWCKQVQQDGCDTAALLLIKDSNDNKVFDNSLRNSGDGVFSAAQEGATHWGADRNEYVRNDCSFAKHIGLEATFTEENVFLENVAAACGRYGFWLGYSRNVLVRGNFIEGNAFAGISNESVQHARYEDNLIRANQVGVELRRGTFSLLNQDSRDHVFVKNLVQQSTGVGLSIVDTHEVTLSHCTIEDNAKGNLRFGASKELEVQGPLRVVESSILLGGAPYNVRNEQKTAVGLQHNWWGTTDPAAIAATIQGLEQYAIIPPHRIARLEVEFMLGADGPYTLRRVVNERANDATDTDDPTATAHGNAQPDVRLGRTSAASGAPRYVAGFRFRDVYLPATAQVLAARLVLPAVDPLGPDLALSIRGEASDDAQPFEAGSMPLARPTTTAAVPFAVTGAWGTAGWVTTPDVTPIVLEILARPLWQSGNAFAFLIDDANSQGWRAIVSFDRAGYLTLPGTPYEFRRYRKHRFAKLEAEFALAAAEMAIERELAGGNDDADNCTGCNEVHLGFNGGNQVDGFRFPDLKIPAQAVLDRAHLWMPTDGTYTNQLDLRLWAERLLAPASYAPGNLPISRPKTALFVSWQVTGVWHYLEWHPTPDLVPLLDAVRALPGWTSGNPVAVDITNAGSPGHRRVWAFDRDPRIIPHDFPEIGATPFVPFLQAPPGR